ncbi:SDR family oxidoreductase [Kribbella sp. NBC_01245]|uniref:SDR family oxidoreductase n=1 Tax=Kribbella sp. NBC_01245 TaxID=2903578 RepID=UPI002E2D84E4|nr:SDR family oxidoreductase [Kribbella sp. NBC_01245]
MGEQSRIAVVTGAGGGIGAACAIALAGQYDATLCVDRDLARATATAEAIGGLVLQADAEDPDFGQTVAAEIAKHGRTAVVVHALAYEEHAPAADLTRESMLRSLALGPVAAFSLFQACASDGAALIAIGSLHETQPFRNCVGYNAAHGALGQVVRTLAHEWAPRRIRVNAVVPGWIETPGERELYGADHLAMASAGLPFGAMGTAAQIAEAVAFVASASYMSGSFVTVDGGLSVSLARLPGEA